MYLFALKGNLWNTEKWMNHAGSKINGCLLDGNIVFTLQEKDKVETLEQKQKDLERSSQRMQTCLEEVNRDLNHSDQEKKSLKAEINSVYEKIHILESKLDEEKRKSSNSYTKIAQLQELVSDQRSKTESSDRRIKQLNQEIQAENAKRREAEFKLEQNRNGNGQGEMSNQVVIESLESEMELLKKQVRIKNPKKKISSCPTSIESSDEGLKFSIKLKKSHWSSTPETSRNSGPQIHQYHLRQYCTDNFSNKKIITFAEFQFDKEIWGGKQKTCDCWQSQ